MKRSEETIKTISLSAFTDSNSTTTSPTVCLTTLVVVKAGACGKTGLGYTYADITRARLISDLLATVVEGNDALNVTANRVCNARRNP